MVEFLGGWGIGSLRKGLEMSQEQLKWIQAKQSEICRSSSIKGNTMALWQVQQAEVGQRADKVALYRQGDAWQALLILGTECRRPDRHKGDLGVLLKK